MLRFRDGIQVGNAIVEAWKGVGTLISAAGGMIMVSRPATLKVALPENVADNLKDDAPIVTTTLWRPGDPIQTIEVVC
jgi:hypothetical protein